MPEVFDPFEYEQHGPYGPPRQIWIGGQPVIVHIDDLPESDVTTVHGIRVTTPLRTVIDIAPELDWHEFEHVVRDCLERGLFTVDRPAAGAVSCQLIPSEPPVVADQRRHPARPTFKVVTRITDRPTPARANAIVCARGRVGWRARKSPMYD